MLRAAVVAKLGTSYILSSISLILGLYASFLTIFISTTSPDFFKSTETCFNLSTFYSANLIISNLPTSDLN